MGSISGSRAWPRRAAWLRSVNSPGRQTGISARRLTRSRCNVWSTDNSANRSRPCLAAASPRRPTVSFSWLAVLEATPVVSTRIMARSPGSRSYTHISDRYEPFYTKLIAATASEALHVLDALLYHQSDVSVLRHHTDGGGDSDHVFALCALLGFKFSPRIPDLKHRRLYSFEKPSAYPTLEPLIAGRIDIALIRAHWADVLRIGASIRSGTVTASLIMRQLASHPRQNGVAAALRGLGRLKRTLFSLDWIEDPELRRGTGQELNKGESRNSLARAVFIHRLGEIRDRTYENQQHRASGLNLVVSAIILWNTRYLERAADVLRKFEDVPDSLLAHLSPLGWEHVNLTGDYVWGVEQSLSENIDGLRSLRTQADALQKAA